MVRQCSCKIMHLHEHTWAIKMLRCESLEHEGRAFPFQEDPRSRKSLLSTSGHSVTGTINPTSLLQPPPSLLTAPLHKSMPYSGEMYAASPRSETCLDTPVARYILCRYLYFMLIRKFLSLADRIAVGMRVLCGCVDALDRAAQ